MKLGLDYRVVSGWYRRDFYGVGYFSRRVNLR